MTDEIQRNALARSIAVRLPLCSLDETRVLDVVLCTIEQVRGCGDRQWQRRIATGAHDVDRSWHLARRRSSLSGIDTVETACKGRWSAGDAAETSPNPPLDERCDVCWREACGGSAIGMALLEVARQLAIQDAERAELHEQARAEMFPPAAAPREDTGPIAAAAEFTEEHATRIGGPEPYESIAIELGGEGG